ncbi:hypothetical protein BD309DRAFT_949442 [Dichomitus squalens]|nr:hypothetical protein BD309DRAFT_949442 [Dichomitus squalens]
MRGRRMVSERNAKDQRLTSAGCLGGHRPRCCHTALDTDDSMTKPADRRMPGTPLVRACYVGDPFVPLHLGDVSSRTLSSYEHEGAYSEVPDRILNVHRLALLPDRSRSLRSQRRARLQSSPPGLLRYFIVQSQSQIARYRARLDVCMNLRVRLPAYRCDIARAPPRGSVSPLVLPIVWPPGCAASAGVWIAMPDAPGYSQGRNQSP